MSKTIKSSLPILVGWAADIVGSLFTLFLVKDIFVCRSHKHEQFTDYIYIHGIRHISQVIYLLQYFYGSLHWRKIKESRDTNPRNIDYPSRLYLYCPISSQTTCLMAMGMAMRSSISSTMMAQSSKLKKIVQLLSVSRISLYSPHFQQKHD